METTDIRKFQSRTASAVGVFVFFNAKPGKGKDLEKILQMLVAPTRSDRTISRMCCTDLPKILTTCCLTRYLSQ